MGSREYRLDHSTGPFDHFKLDHILNNVKVKGHLFVSMMSQPVKSIIKAQRTACLRAASLHLELTFATSLLRTLCGLQRGGAILGRRHSCRFVMRPAVTEGFPQVKSKDLEV